MAGAIRLVQGDDLPGISFFIRDSNHAASGVELDRKDSSTWRPVNLLGCTVTAAVAMAGQNSQIATLPVTVLQPAVGEVLLHLADSPFMGTAGQYSCEVTVLFSSGQQTVYDMLTFDVRERINATPAN